MIQGNLLLLLLINHFLADFYFQTDEIASKKCINNKKMFKHILYYFIVNCTLMLFYGVSVFFLIISLIVFHFLIDFLKCKFSRNNGSKSNNVTWRVFVFDQFVHIISIIVIYMIFSNNVSIESTAIQEYIITHTSTNITELLAITLSIIILVNPTNVLMKIFLSKYQFTADSTGLKDAGELIGKLERVIIFIFIFLQAYSAVGFVLIAKSIFRSDKITESNKCAEYYLIGTLLSSLCVFIVYIFLFFT